MFCPDGSCVTKSFAVAHNNCLSRLCVQTGVNNGHLLEDEGEYILRDVESRVLGRED
jgi:hypothetical protein